ncbi:hypothetical protein GCM10010211_82220 [Streptomyces albospinus]|uniref:Uncharacterized protein n=1 Tax=Streptomyces albospinus TaxID=285515 RepID=A0ABQ2VQZ1_9ACTN|nr:hypothetical protein [Streptomyces albospinus]GGV02424.1 hypothetical protein GCM10010211_82220 [Streptomyces albospinus]
MPAPLRACALAAVAACGLVAVEAGRWPALGTSAAFTLRYIFWLTRRMPRSAGHEVAGQVAGLGFAALITGVGIGSPRLYLDALGKEGMATVVDHLATRTYGGKDYICPVGLPHGDSRQLQASSRTCERLEPLLADQASVVYDPAHVVLPIAGTKG